jgi:hypothetical protein
MDCEVCHARLAAAVADIDRAGGHDELRRLVTIVG